MTAGGVEMSGAGMSDSLPLPSRLLVRLRHAPASTQACLLGGLLALLGAVLGLLLMAQPHGNAPVPHAAQSVAEAATARAQLLACYNAPYLPGPATFAEFQKPRNSSRPPPPRLHMHALHWSARRSTLPLTVFVALTASRLEALRAQCASWDGPLSAAVYVPLMMERQQAEVDSGGWGAAAGGAAGGAAPSTARRVLLQQQQQRVGRRRRPGHAARGAAGTGAGAGVAAAAAAGHAPMVVTPASQALLAQTAAAVEALFNATEAAGARGGSGCQLRISVVTEQLVEEVMAALLPINALRNAALMAAQTPMVAMVDADLLTSTSLAAAMAHRSRAAALGAQLAQRKLALIMPAFETAPSLGLAGGAARAQQAAALRDKRELLPLVRAGDLRPFAVQAYARGHNATDYPRWYTASQAYDAKYDANYEPWFIIDRWSNPLYDTRFRGYGWNKVSHVAHLAALGYALSVQPDLWLVHWPHERSSAQQLYIKAYSQASQDKSLAAKNAKLFHRRVGAMRHVVTRDMKRGTYSTLPEAGSVSCLARLPWWQQ